MMDFLNQYTFNERLSAGVAAISIVIFLYIIYRQSRKKGRGKRRLPSYAKTTPTKHGDYYSIISFWSVDHESQDMVIHNINPASDEAKMIILKSDAGLIMRMYDRSGLLLEENFKMTMYELAEKFMELRQPPKIDQPFSTHKAPKKSRTIEFK